MRAALLIALVACGKSDNADKLEEFGAQQVQLQKAKAIAKEKALAQPDAPAANPQPDLKASLAGKPTPIQSVLATNYDDGQVRIYIYNFKATCEDVTSGTSLRSSEPTDLDLTLRIGKFLHADGTLGWGTRGTYWHNKAGERSTMQREIEDGADPFPKPTAIDATAGKTFELPLAIEMKTSDNITLAVTGTAKVTGCGDQKRKTDEPVPAPLGGTIKIAGHALPIGGAGIIVKKDGSRELQLGTHEVKCVEGSDYTTTRSDLYLRLAYSKAGALETVSTGGHLVLINFMSDAPKLTATPNKPGSAKELPIKLGGSTTINGYPVALDGTVKAIVCPTPK